MITFNEVIAFIKKAIDKKYNIYSTKCTSSYSHFNIEDFNIDFSFDENLISLYDLTPGRKNINHKFTERDILNIKSLELAIKEMNEERLENIFYNFFKEDDNKPADIYDLDDEEDK